MTEPLYLSKSAFAARIGRSPSYITWLKDNDRLVLAPNGKHVDVLATEAKILDTADPSKAAVAARHQQDRVQRDVRSHLSPLAETNQLSIAAPLPKTQGGQGADFQKARAHREYYLAQLAEAEFHKVQGTQVHTETVKKAAYNAGRMLRDQLMGMPPQLASELASMTDPWEIERHLSAAIRRCLDDAGRLSAADLEHSLNPTS